MRMEISLLGKGIQLMMETAMYKEVHVMLVHGILPTVPERGMMTLLKAAQKAGTGMVMKAHRESSRNSDKYAV